MIGTGNRSTRRKPALVPLCPPQTPHAARMRSRAAAVGSQRLTASATAWPLLGKVLRAVVMKSHSLILGNNAVLSLESVLTFRSNMLLPSSGSKKEKQARNKDEPGSWFLDWLTHRPVRWKRYFPPELRDLCVTARTLAVPLKFNLPRLVYKFLILLVACKSKHCTIPAGGEQGAYL
jgi:hypothetical protein